MPLLMEKNRSIPCRIRKDDATTAFIQHCIRMPNLHSETGKKFKKHEDQKKRNETIIIHKQYDCSQTKIKPTYNKRA